MECKDVFAKIDALTAEYLDILEECCCLESPTADKARVDAVGKYFLALAEKKGYAAEVFPVEVSGDVVTITMNGDAKDAPISLSGHIDTVHPVGLFGTPAVRRDDTFMYGPGVLDCKGGIVAGLLAMEALAAQGYDARPIRMLLQTDEEKGSTPSGKRTIRHICESSLDSCAFINLEGMAKDSFCISTKGIARYEFKVTGKAVHSSRCHMGANAVTEAAHKILALEAHKDPDTITCNCGVIHGGTVPNSVAAECVFYADIRFVTAAQMAEVDRFVHEIADHVYVEGCTTEVALVSERPPMERTEKNLALCERANQALVKASLAPLGLRDGLGGTDGAYVTEYGIPCLEGLGVSGSGVHSVSEKITLASLAESAKRIAAIILGS